MAQEHEDNLARKFQPKDLGKFDATMTELTRRHSHSSNTDEVPSVYRLSTC